MAKLSDNRYHPMLGIVLCCMLCSITLFAFSHRFVNAELTPKWMRFMLAVGIMGMAWSVRYHRILLPSRPVNAVPIFGTVVVFALALSIQGVLQYAGIISSANRNFTITGNFDNPSGFASAIACATPRFLNFRNAIFFLKPCFLNFRNAIFF